ncbi:MAG: hypothetical protein WAQ98_05290, partial [Blastocatellia bacterium]
TQLISPFSQTIAPFSIIESSLRLFFVRGLDGPANVTSCLMLVITNFSITLVSYTELKFWSS